MNLVLTLVMVLAEAIYCARGATGPAGPTGDDDADGIVIVITYF